MFLSITIVIEGFCELDVSMNDDFRWRKKVFDKPQLMFFGTTFVECQEST